MRIKPEGQQGLTICAGASVLYLTLCLHLPAALPFTTMIEQSGDLRDPAARGRAVGRVAESEREIRTLAISRAQREGLPLRVERPDGQLRELAAFHDNQPLYRTTLNINAAISSGANLLWTAPYSVNGAGYTVGVWDGGSAWTSHREFAGRVTVRDNSSPINHATHVCGTIAAAGVTANAKGMAPSVNISSYDWNSDISEMTAAGASWPGEPDKINISNHSYGYISGWYYLNQTIKWEWYGNGSDATAVEADFGQYSEAPRDLDALLYALPYYQVFWAAGNDRDNNPAAGSTVALTPGGSGVSYDPARHPPGDGLYRSGYDTISFYALAKNAITVGSATDAVSGGLRSPTSALINNFSSYGPTDDGRIKPDLVANGWYLYSPVAGSDSSYATYSGTSMASPNAAGTAQLLINCYDTLFPGYVMRAATLKALLIHTADDRGNTGPDYIYGWGLINGQGAADLLQNFRSRPNTRTIIEDRLTTSRASCSYSFTWNGTTPIRATLCWTDPAGAAAPSGDSRTPRLVNNLDLRIITPDNTVFEPWVMPFVGNWSTAACAASAVTGSNTTDNVEQVLISQPPAAGIYQLRVSFAGTLTNGSQPFGVILSGVSPTSAAPAPLLTASSPLKGTGPLIFTLTGDHIMPGALITLIRSGEPERPLSNIDITGDIITARADTSGMAQGWWNIRVTNPDGKRVTLQNAFVVPGTLWREDFDSGDIFAEGWSVMTELGSSQWQLSTAACVSPPNAMFSPAADSRSDTALVSPLLAIDPESSDLRLAFMHNFSLESSQDGGVLELSIDGGAWFDVTASGSGASFTSNGYNGKLSNTGKPDTLNPLAPRNAWTGTSSGFKQVSVNLTDTAKYAGHTLRIRWRLATNSATASPGWHIDDVVLSGIRTPPVPITIYSGTILLFF